MAVIELVKTEDFQSEVVESPLPVVVDFHASWCGPCRITGPILTELASGDWEGKIKVVKVDVDAHGELASNFSVTAIPTLLLFKEGKVAARQVGVLPREALIEWGAQ